MENATLIRFINFFFVFYSVTFSRQHFSFANFLAITCEPSSQEFCVLKSEMLDVRGNFPSSQLRRKLTHAAWIEAAGVAAFWLAALRFWSGEGRFSHGHVCVAPGVLRWTAAWDGVGGAKWSSVAF
jgi:hypothetical protein